MSIAKIVYTQLNLMPIITLWLWSSCVYTYHITRRQHHRCDKDEPATKLHDGPPLVLVLNPMSHDDGESLQLLKLFVLGGKEDQLTCDTGKLSCLALILVSILSIASIRENIFQSVLLSVRVAMLVTWDHEM